MDLLIPIAGRSTRFRTNRPKWSLTMPNGKMMFENALSRLKNLNYENIYVIAVKKQVESFTTVEVINNICRDSNIKTIWHDDFTNSQSETIVEALKKNQKIGEKGIFIKDCDNLFDVEGEGNFVSYVDLHNCDLVTPGNKSYIKLDELGNISAIEEKSIISPFFCCGGYGFINRDLIIELYNKCKSQINLDEELFLSHLIYQAILDGINFKGIEAKNYQDLGTQEDYDKYNSFSRILFCDVDGVLLFNGGRMHPNGWHTDIILENVRKLIELQNQEMLTIYLTTSRDEQSAEYAKSKLEKEGLKISGLIHSVPHGKRYLINDFSSSNKFPTAISINLPRNSTNLDNFL